MPLPRSTNNSLAAGVVSSESSNAGAVPVSSAPTPSSSLLADSIAEAVVRALGSSLPGILSSIQVNAPSSQASSSNPSTSTAVTSEVFSAQFVPTSAVSSTVARPQVAVASVPSSPGTLALPPFVLLSRLCRPSPARARPARWFRFLPRGPLFRLLAFRSVFQRSGRLHRNSSCRKRLLLALVMRLCQASW